MLLDTGFRPSRHGFGFGNSWRDVLLGVVPSRGRCGGMVFVAQECFEAGVTLPAGADSSTLPARGSALERLIWRRQIESVVTRGATNLLRFVRYTYERSDAPGGLHDATLRDLVPLFDLLRSGKTVPMGLVSAIGLAQLPRNHQVLAYAAEFGHGSVTVRVYDPNHPGRDDVTLEIPLERGGPLAERIGRTTRAWRGAFVERRGERTGCS